LRRELQHLPSGFISLSRKVWSSTSAWRMMDNRDSQKCEPNCLQFYGSIGVCRLSTNSLQKAGIPAIKTPRKYGWLEPFHKALTLWLIRSASIF
jgi:hypothetical protein